MCGRGNLQQQQVIGFLWLMMASEMLVSSCVPLEYVRIYFISNCGLSKKCWLVSFDFEVYGGGPIVCIKELCSFNISKYSLFKLVKG